jgi:hypothetical protein
VNIGPDDDWEAKTRKVKNGEYPFLFSSVAINV